MAGIYIHIPFCKQACNYCNFHFSTQQKNVPAMVDAIILEMGLRKNYLQEKIATIYFGGGTPSVLQNSDIIKIIEAIKNNFEIDEQVEITLEANPDDIQEEKLQTWKSAGINRLSIGVQSFVAEDLLWMNRAHNNTMALQSLQWAKKYFSNISIDLIYGTPTLSDEQWLQNINQAIALQIPHLSCYALTVEPKTVLHSLIEKKEVQDVDADKQARHFEILTKRLHQAGFEHYEISNFAKPNYRSKHNSSYWQGKHYLGLGPSAHSFNGVSRQWNIANNVLYLKSIEQKIIPYEIEILTATQQLNEYIMTSLRTIEGINLQKIQIDFGEIATTHLIQQATTAINAKHVCVENNFLRLTDAGKFLADGIAADLFGEEKK